MLIFGYHENDDGVLWEGYRREGSKKE